jgi:hypothetical protein
VLALAACAIAALWVMPGTTNLMLSYFSVAAFAQQSRAGEIRLVNAALRYVAGLGKSLFAGSIGLPFAGWALLKSLRQLNGKFRLRDLVLPVAAIATFSFLLAEANPLIESAINVFSWNPLHSLLRSSFFWLCLFAALLIGAISSAARLPAMFGDGLLSRRLPGESLIGRHSVSFTLFALNALFLVQNLTDATYLWSGRVLPEHMTYAEYAHRGAYTLIGTALLAAALIVFVMRPDSDNERSPLLRALTFAWIAQNLFLVVSTALRIMNYVDAYGWTPLRLDVLVFLTLVTIGFVLIGLRLLRGWGSIWLMEANTWSLMLTFIVVGFSILPRSAMNGTPSTG